MSDRKDHQAPPRAVVQWRDESNNQRELILREGESAKLGREPDNAVTISNPQVSRHHALISWKENTFQIADLGSTNGTLVNGARIEQPRVLQDGDVIRLFDVDLSFHLVKPEPPPEKPHAAQTIVVPASGPQPRLIIRSGFQQGRTFDLVGNKVLIGRATAKENWEIALQDRAVSRPHAQLERKENGFVLTDLSSANGTSVNGALITSATPLKDGDEILLGETTLVFKTS